MQDEDVNMSTNSIPKHNDRKLQEEKLFESQENVLEKLSQVFSQSSYSTNIGDLEESQLQGSVGNSTWVKEAEEEKPTWVYNHVLRSGKVLKITNSPRKLNEDMDMEESQESVSMLQGFCDEKSSKFPDLDETCMDSELEIEVEDEEPSGRMVVASTQTDFTTFGSQRPEEELSKHSAFIGSVIKLKSLLTSKKKLSEKELWDILNTVQDEGSSSEDEEMEVERPSTVSKETIAYLLRSSDAETVLSETVRAVLLHLEEVLEEDLWRLSCFWENSVYKTAVEMVNQAVETEPGMRNLIDAFLYKAIGGIFRNETQLKNLALESKAMFVISFCQTTYPAYTAVNYIINRLKTLKTINHHERPTLSEKTTWMNLTKTSYLLLRILEALLLNLKPKLQSGTNFPAQQQQQQRDFNVLNMWRKHWKQDNNHQEQEGKPPTEQWRLRVRTWCHELDDILVHCISHLPINSIVVERCSRLVKDILKLSPNEDTQSKQ